MLKLDINEFNKFVSSIFHLEVDSVPLHRPLFSGNEKQYLSKCIDSNFVSSVGSRVKDFELSIANYVGVKHAVSAVSGTAALHAALVALNVQPGNEVLTQAISFVATANAISYCGAHPIFVDADKDSLGMSPTALRQWLIDNTAPSTDGLINKLTKSRIAACVPMHTFGLPCRILEIVKVCKEFGIPVVEDAAEALGSFVGNKHAGAFGTIGTFSFNGNKIITTGGGGMLTLNNGMIADKLKHLTTTAKTPHAYEYFHDEVGFNYRMPNLNAALGVAQFENLEKMLLKKRLLAEKYEQFFENKSMQMVKPLVGSRCNHWLNAIILKNRAERDEFLNQTNANGIMTRPIWSLLSELPMYKMCQTDKLENSKWLSDRVVNLPSSVPFDWI